MSLAALGLSGCTEETAAPVEKEAKSTDARFVVQTPAYTDMGQGVFLIHAGGMYQSPDNQHMEFASHLATWKREHPDRSINIMLPLYGRELRSGAIIETIEKPSAPAK
jgi:hypothetical protein